MKNSDIPNDKLAQQLAKHVEDGNPLEVLRLLKNGASPTYLSPLEVAVYPDGSITPSHEACALLLIGAGATGDKETLLHAAAGGSSLLFSLLSDGVDVHSDDVLGAACFCDHLAEAEILQSHGLGVEQAWKGCGHIKLVHELLELGVPVTPYVLKTAVESGNPWIMKAILRTGLVPDASLTEYAVHRGRPEIAELLAHLGKQPETQTSTLT